MSQEVALASKQVQAIKALLTSPTLGKAAESIGVSRKTLERWLTQDDFKAALRAAEQDSLETLNRVMVGYAVQPLAVLIEIMNDKKQAGGVRVRAAAAFLGILLRYRELVVLEERLTALEQQREGNE